MTDRLKFCLIAVGIAFSAQALAEDKSAAEGAADGEEPYLATETLESCMKRWDAKTHMTKSAWRDTCKRISRSAAASFASRVHWAMISSTVHAMWTPAYQPRL